MNIPLAKASERGIEQSIVDGFRRMDDLYAEKDQKLLSEIDKAQAKVIAIEEARELSEPPTKWDTRAKVSNDWALFTSLTAANLQIIQIGLKAKEAGKNVAETLLGLSSTATLSSSGVVPILIVVNAALEYSGAWNKLESFVVSQTGWNEEYVKATFKAARVGLSLGLSFGNLYSMRSSFASLKTDFLRLITNRVTGRYSTDILDGLKAASQVVASFFTSIGTISSAKQNYDMAMHKAEDLKRQKELEKWTEKLTGATKKLIRYQNDRSRHFRAASGLLRT
jgi:hypothetical protein